MRCHCASRTDAAPKHNATTLALQIERVWQPNLQVYDIDKVWWQLARCTVERLLQCLRLRGVLRGKAVRTTIRNAKAARR
jgi:putative transposase